METLDRWRITGESPLGETVLVVLALTLAASFVASWWNTRVLVPQRRVTLRLLRAGALLVALAVLYEPAVLTERVAPVRSTVAVLVDGSASMGLPVRPDGPTRAETADRWFERRGRWWSGLTERFDVERFVFGEALRPMDPDGAAEPTDTATDVARVLEAVRTRSEGEPLAGVIVVSDGVDNAALGDLFTATGRLPADLYDYGTPIHAVGVGEPAALKDYGIRDLYYEDFGFVKNELAVRAVIEVSGYGPATVPVTLTSGDETLATQNVRLGPGRNEVTLTFVPRHVGHFVYTVRIPTYADEVVAANNRRSFAVQVIRDRVRVLHVVGQPSWDGRFLRRLLERNPNVDVIGFFILRTPEDSATVPQRELSLIPFPTEELFTRELASFDLIVLQNFNYKPYVRPEYLTNMARYVREGGGLVMIGGELSFSAGGYSGTPIESVLPVSLRGVGSPFVLGDYRIEPTEAGLRHPIMQLDARPTENVAQWRALPELAGANRVRDVRDSAQVLAWGPRDTGGGRVPLISVSDVGEGRVMAITTDTTWRWSFMNAEIQGTGDAYHQFWDNAIRWLIKDPEYSTLRVNPARTRFAPDEPVEATVEVLGDDYLPLADATVRVEVERLPEGTVVREAFAQTDASGRYELSLEGAAGGFYRINAESGSERAQALAEVATDDREVRTVSLGHNLLRTLATASGGTFSTVDQDRDLLRAELEAVDRYEVLGRELRSLWDRAWVIVLFVALAGTEWLLRKRWGLA